MATLNLGLLTCTGNTQGAFKCAENPRVEADLKFADGIEAAGWSWNATVPIDPSRLVVAGRCTLGTFSIWKLLDSCSPKIFQACATGEVFKSWTLVINKIDKTGKAKKFYQWDLTNAICCKIEQQVGEHEDKDGKNLSTHDLERIDFIYETMTHTNLWQNTVATYSMVGASK